MIRAYFQLEVSGWDEDEEENEAWVTPVLYFGPEHELPKELEEALDHYIDWGGEQRADDSDGNEVWEYYCGFDPCCDRVMDQIEKATLEEIARLTPIFERNGYALDQGAQVAYV